MSADSFPAQCTQTEGTINCGGRMTGILQALCVSQTVGAMDLAFGGGDECDLWREGGRGLLNGASFVNS